MLLRSLVSTDDVQVAGERLASLSYFTCLFVFVALFLACLLIRSLANVAAMAVANLLLLVVVLVVIIIHY